MTLILKTVTLGLVFFLATASTFAQHTHVKYGMSGTGEMGTYLQGSALDLYFSPDNFKMVIGMMGMIEMDTRMDTKKKKGLMLMDMMGQKKYKLITEDDMKADASDATAKMPEIRYLDEYETIAGYKCQKALVEVEESEKPIVVFFTEDLKMPDMFKDYMEQLNVAGIKGFPLGYEVEVEGEKITIKAIEVDTKKRTKDFYSIKIPEGYTEMTEDDVKVMPGLGQ